MRLAPARALAAAEAEIETAQRLKLQHLHMRMSKRTSLTKMVTADSITTGISRWRGDFEQEPLEQVELHGQPLCFVPPSLFFARGWPCIVPHVRHLEGDLLRVA